LEVLWVRVLVTYASVHGSTRRIAEHLAARLRDGGLLVDCLPVQATPAVADYDAVVVGSAIHGRAWLPEAANLLSTHAAELRTKWVWLFSVGMAGALARPLRTFAMREGPKAVAPYAQTVRPRDTRLFTGVVSRQQFPPLSRAVLRLMGGRYGDLRDWVEIDAWADTISGSLIQEMRFQEMRSHEMRSHEMRSASRPGAESDRTRPPPHDPA
jgi:menaquinone-dependent protoporphyrinogen oxidase